MSESIDQDTNDQSRDERLYAWAAADQDAAASYGHRLAERGISASALLDEFFVLRAAVKDDPEATARLDAACNAALEAYVERRLQRVAEAAERDPVTGLPGRAAFDKALTEEIARAARYGRVFSLALLDLDGFKTINDRFGHQAGDVLLGEAARALRASLRESDRVFRYGGDEFAVLSPETRAEDLALALGRIEADWRGPIGFSWGIAGFPEDATTAEMLVHLADQRLYQSKRRRRPYIP